MPTADTFPLISDAALQDLADRGMAVYEKMKPQLEPQHNGQYVVIHVDTEDYAIGRTFHEANRAMRARHPLDGRLFGIKIGSEPDNDSLAARIVLSEMGTARAK